MGEDKGGQKAARAGRIGRHMSYQLLDQDEQWEEDTDRKFIVLPIIGCAFKKTYWDPLKQKNCSRLVLPQNLVVLNVRGELTGMEVETAEAFVESIQSAIETVRRHRDAKAEGPGAGRPVG